MNSEEIHDMIQNSKTSAEVDRILDILEEMNDYNRKLEQRISVLENKTMEK